MKKVLWISDDERDEELYSDEDMTFTMLAGFKYIEGFDLVLVDYGFLGGRKKDDQTENRKQHRNDSRAFCLLVPHRLVGRRVEDSGRRHAGGRASGRPGIRGSE